MAGCITFNTGLIKPFVIEIVIMYKRLTVEHNVKEHEHNIQYHFESLQQARTDS